MLLGLGIRAEIERIRVRPKNICLTTFFVSQYISTIFFIGAKSLFDLVILSSLTMLVNQGCYQSRIYPGCSRLLFLFKNFAKKFSIMKNVCLSFYSKCRILVLICMSVIMSFFLCLSVTSLPWTVCLCLRVTKHLRYSFCILAFVNKQ